MDFLIAGSVGTCGRQNLAMLTIGEWLRSQRTRKHWSLSRAASELEISQDALHRIEKGRTETPQPRTMEKIVQVFGDLPSGLAATDDPPSRAASADPQTNTEQWMRIVGLSTTLPRVVEMVADRGDGWDEVEVLKGDALQGEPPEVWSIVTLRGDDMAPRFRDGQRVLVRTLLPGDEPNIGVDYLFVRKDEQTATLRRLQRVSKDSYYLRALNQKNDQLLHVRKDEVMVGEPRFFVSDIPV